ncbi:uncharacterized protein METZ01_LOCUS11952 [marine metagenome]|uniref:Uncharacterized protein n=1 Tax=marine metagenome TaxID=408172 RepID=A0A381NYW2_9ZZZZ|tara:strand:- start:209 stop:541 length:333 start_codon:yes stop_codon:yes gene_type:complete
MMKIEDIVNDIVLIVLDNYEPLKGLGINEGKIYAHITGYDEFGIWMKHPKFRIPKADINSTPKKPAYQNVTASILIPWGFIASVVHFPNVEGFDFPNPFEKHIGFESEVK